MAGCGCHKESGPPAATASETSVWFEDSTEKSGLRFVQGADPLGRFFMPEIVAGWKSRILSRHGR